MRQNCLTTRIFLCKYRDEKKLTPSLNDVCDCPIQKSRALYQGMTEISFIDIDDFKEQEGVFQ